MMGCMPALLAVTENSNAANRLFVSVTAMAGMSMSVHIDGNFFKRIAPSSREYSV
jgi:hypothetical protein